MLQDERHSGDCMGFLCSIVLLVFEMMDDSHSAKQVIILLLLSWQLLLFKFW